jgi:hypothetical protein
MKDDAITGLVLALKLGASHQSGRYATMQCPFGFWRHPNGKSNNHAFGIERGGGMHCMCFSCG